MAHIIQVYSPINTAVTKSIFKAVEPADILHDKTNG